MSTSGRVAKNTAFLYIRMGLTLFVNLYSTRLILASLGEVDFGIFNVIGGSIAMMGFLNSTLANATQRFMSYAEGKGDIENKKTIFNVSLLLHVAIAVLTVVLLLGILPLLFGNVLNIPDDRISTAKIVYYTLIFTTFLTIVNVPYDAVLNAHENMFTYAVLGILETLLRLLIAFACVNWDGNRLLLYSILMAVIPLITLSILKGYCHKHYSECIISIKKYWDFDVVKRIASFSGWNFLTAITSLFTIQGLSVVLNHFFGTILNAAQGIASQVNGYLTSCSTSMMKAINPIIVKRTASGTPEDVARVTFTSAKFSALLILFFAVPVTIKMEYILSVWLTNVPEWAVIFCQLQLLQTVISQMANPSATAIYGKGHIKHYAIWKSIMNICPLALSILAFSINWTPIWLYLSLIIFMGLGGDIVIARYASKDCGLSANKFVIQVVIPIILTGAVMGVFGLLSNHIIRNETFWNFGLVCIASTIGLIMSMITFGLSVQEKKAIASLIVHIKDRLPRRL